MRKSVGARRRDILNQFLVESSMLAGIGGVMGVTIAWLAAVLVRSFTPVPMEVPLYAVLHRRDACPPSSDCSSESIRRARPRALDPIVALRAES